MIDLVEYGLLEADLDSLIERVRAVPKEAWTYRSDKESYNTAALRPGNPAYIDAEKFLEATFKYFKPGYFSRVVYSLIPAGKSIDPHVDDFGEELRNTSLHCHIPLITDEKVIMGFGEEGKENEYHLKAGHLYSMDETIRHYVHNYSDVDRVHLLFAYHPHDKCLT